MALGEISDAGVCSSSAPVSPRLHTTTTDHPGPNAYMKPSYPTRGSQVRSLDSSEERQVSQGENRNCATSLQASHPLRDLDKAAHSLNGRPRQTLGGMSPSEKLAEVLQ